MKASELRIGNWIFDDEGVLCKVIGFKPYDHSVRCDEEEGCNILIDIYPQDGSIRKGWEVDSSECKPIPLTEEWLVRFGFGKDKDGLSWHYNHGLWMSIGKNQFFAFGHSKWSIKYVHQLQNLYFALTGEELQYKP